MSGSLVADSEALGFLGGLWKQGLWGARAASRGAGACILQRPHGAPWPQDSEAGTALLSCPTFRKRDRTSNLLPDRSLGVGCP